MELAVLPHNGLRPSPARDGQVFCAQPLQQVLAPLIEEFGSQADGNAQGRVESRQIEVFADLACFVKDESTCFWRAPKITNIESTEDPRGVLYAHELFVLGDQLCTG